MKTDPEKILADRERRNGIIRKAARDNGAVSVRANIPGNDKRIPESWLIVRHFAATVAAETGIVPFLYEGADGPAAIFRNPPAGFKKRASEIEETHPAGRFADIDVYDGTGRSESRGYTRKCYVCGKPAFVCGRNGEHTTGELLSAIRGSVRPYFAGRISGCVRDALTAELEIEDKFGLVTPSSSGSHRDMDFGTMEKARDAIVPFFPAMFFEGTDERDLSVLREKIRIAGLEAEKAMLEATGGANAYKGFIFSAGILLTALGRTAVLPGGNVYTAAARLCEDILDEFGKYPGTFGDRAYAEYGVTGARGEAHAGFPAVERAVEEIGGDRGGANLLAVLARTAGRIEDTVLLKRAGSMEKYGRFRTLVSSADTGNPEAVKNLTNLCVRNNISIGGSADVLATAVMMSELLDLLYFAPGERTREGQTAV